MAQDQEAVASHPSAQPTDSNNDPLAIKDEDAPEDRDGTASDTSADEQMAASKNRDPDRPKRRKARRACAACQRAHLTCSMFLSASAEILLSQIKFMLVDFNSHHR